MIVKFSNGLLSSLIFIFLLVAASCDEKEPVINNESPDDNDSIPDAIDTIQTSLCDSVPSCGDFGVNVETLRWKMRIRADGGWGPAEFPRNSPYEPIYAGGIWIGASHNGAISVSSTMFGDAELSPGIILNHHTAPVSELVFCDQTTSCIYLAKPYTYVPFWPRVYGAPVNPNGSPVVNSNVDTWTVYHDLDVSRHSRRSGPPLGLEIRQSTYAYDYSQLQDVIKVTYRIKNKSDITYSDILVGFFCDPDMGNPYQNYAGSDYALKMVYAYEKTSYGAVGIKFVSSSIVVNAAAGVSYFNGQAPYSDSAQFNLLKGLTLDGNKRNNVLDLYPTWDYPGDPVTGTGILDQTAGDKRILLSVGPISIAPGNTVELTFAIIATEGYSAQSSVSRLKSLATQVN